MLFRVLTFILAAVFSPLAPTRPESVGRLAGDGGWNSEDANHLKPSK